MKRKNKEEIEEIIDEAEEIHYDKSGNVVIRVGLKSKDDFYSPYSDKNYKILNEDMLTFIEKNAQDVPNNETVALEIMSDNEIGENEQEQMADAIRRQYAENLTTLNLKLKKNMFLVLLFSIIGLGFLTLAIFLEKLEISSILENTIMIIAWVFLWDGAEHFFFTHISLLHEKRITKKFLNCEIRIKKY